MSDSRTSVQEPILGAWTLSSYVIADVSGENREYPSCFAVFLALSLVRGPWGHAGDTWFVDLGG
jgi:hypothetical protein